MKISRPNLGIALGSGVARGWAHIGVLRGLQRLGIHPDIVCGTSIGAFVGGLYVAGRMDSLENWARDLNKLRITRLFDFQFAHGGLIAGRRIMQLFDPELHQLTIEQLPTRYACVCTDIDSGHEVWLQEGNLFEAVRASYALPGIFPPVEIGGRWLVDGALVNPVPVSVCRAMGARVVIGVNLNTEVFEPGTPKASGEVDDADERAILRRMGNLPGADFIRQMFNHQNHEPSILSVMARSLDIVQDRISRARLAGDPPDVSITPKLGGIGILQFDRAAEAISAGEAAVEAATPALVECLRRINRWSPA